MNVEKIIEQLISDLRTIKDPNSIHWNERYLHHKFSYLVQKESGFEINVTDAPSKLHPEWATSIKDKKRDGGFYARNDNGYEPRDNRKDSKYDSKGGNPGFIDFAIGDFDKPDYAVEFKMAKYMDAKGFAFDYMKLLDNRNRFKKGVISLSVVLGRKTKLEKNDLDKNLEDATKELGEYLSKPVGRKVLFYVIQIDEGKEPNVWKCTNVETGFEQV
mgnify:CR=1 FL=1